MTGLDYREIPYNYTSAGDEQIVSHLFGRETWTVLERLRDKRVTGRSARLLLRFMGDMFMLRRNPFLREQLVSPRRLRSFVRMARNDLEIVARNSAGEPLVSQVIEQCQRYLSEREQELLAVERDRVRIRGVLGAIVGAEHVVFDPFTLISHATDATDWRLCLPLAVVRPGSEDQVGPLLAAIASLGLHAIPRGAGTGLTGGAVPLRDRCVMVNLEKLNRILSIEEVRFPAAGGRTAEVMTLEAGVITETAMRAAAGRGAVFATDPTSAWASTIGGNLAENAGGKTAVLWGTAIDNVLSFRIALASGKMATVTRVDHPLRKIQPTDRVRFRVTVDGEELAETIKLSGNQIRKENLWKDITNKALGGVPGLQKEGTDGVITSARFVLYPAYPKQQTVCLEFFGESMDEAARVILALSQQLLNQGEEALMALEHFDEEYVRAIDYRTKAARDERPKAVLLIDVVAHTEAQLERGITRLKALLQPYPDTLAFFARDRAEAERFWKDRKKLGAIARRTNAFKLNEDIVLPLSALAEFARYIDEYNLSEERHNQEECVRQVLSLLDSLHNGADAEWLEAKIPRARELCELTLGKLGSCPKEELRTTRHLRRLRRELSVLLAGYEQLAQGIEGVFQVVRSRVIVIATHMHAGDGNVHVNIPVFSNDREMMRRATLTADVIMRKAVELGGVVSGEHGIGVTKLRHLDRDRIAELNEHRARLDPGGLLNPGKLSDLDVLDYVFTPSFNLLELEAKILQHDSLLELADRISKCVRCGKCKPDCCVYYPAGNLFYHPRNKNLAIGSLIEALLYEAQRFHSTKFEFLAHLEEVADHCTICHKCLEPCPVNIDTGAVSVLEREILVARGFKRSALATRATLRYLNSTNRTFNAVFRNLVLLLGTRLQRLGAALVLRLPLPASWRRPGRLGLLGSPLSLPAPEPLHRALPTFHANQALVLQPEGEARRTVFYFPGCGSERLFSDVGKASVFILLATGSRVVLPPPFLCCGFPTAANAKKSDHTRRVLGDTILFSQIREMFRYLTFDAVGVSCGTCREALGHMGTSQIFGAPLADVSELALADAALPQSAEARLYHRPCHDSLDGQGPALLLRAGMRVESVPHCCSEAGTLSLSRPDITSKMLARKSVSLAEAATGLPGGATVLTNCPSCLQGLGRSRSLGVDPKHLAVELAERLGGQDWREKLARHVERSETVTF